MPDDSRFSLQETKNNTAMGTTFTQMNTMSYGFNNFIQRVVHRLLQYFLGFHLWTPLL